MKSIAFLKPDHEFVGDFLEIEQVFASVDLSVDPSPKESLQDQLGNAERSELLPENRVMEKLCFSPEATGLEGRDQSWSSFSTLAPKLWEKLII
jgi:hypothetical protein